MGQTSTRANRRPTSVDMAQRAVVRIEAIRGGWAMLGRHSDFGSVLSMQREMLCSH